MLICVASISASAATKYNVTEFKVSDWTTLKSALETKTTDTQPKDLLVTLKSDIDETINKYTDIDITYPGNIILDLNAHNINITTNSGDTLFYLAGTNETVFTIINSKQNSNNYIAFNSSERGTALLESINPNASINILGAHREYASTDSLKASGYNITLKTGLNPDSTDGYLHATLSLRAAKDVYISGAKLENNTKDPVNIYMATKPKSLCLTGKTELYVNPNYQLVDKVTYANIYLDVVLSSYDDFRIFENCYIHANSKIKTHCITESYTSAPDGPYDRSHIGDLTYRSKYTDTTFRSHYEVYTPNKVEKPSGSTLINLNSDFCIKSTCCESDLTKVATVTNCGHINKCSNCNGVISFLFHKFARKMSSGTEATCTTDGRMPTWRCILGNSCSYTNGGQTLKATGHKEITIEGKAATCTATGLTDGKKCSVCDEVTLAQKTIAKTAHKIVTVKGKAATCSKTGLTDGKKCSVCGKVTLPQETIAKKAHTYKTTITKATTSKDGSKLSKCSVCGAVKSKSTIYKIKTVTLSATSYTYNGKTKTPTVTVKDSKGKTLKKDTDYTVTYEKGRKNVGQYNVTVKFKGNYSGTKKLTFKIVPQGTSLSSLSSGKKSFTAKWSKQTSQTTGYQIQYSTSSKMKSAKTATVSKNSTTSQKISSLKSGTTYYVRIRTYKTVKVDGKSVKLYSPWSAIKSVKVK